MDGMFRARPDIRFPAYSELEGDTERKGFQFVSGRPLIGDAGHLVDPLFGEGIYYAVLSGHMVARAILAATSFIWNHWQVYAYEAALEREILPPIFVRPAVLRGSCMHSHASRSSFRRYQRWFRRAFQSVAGARPPHSFCPRRSSG